MEMTFLLAQKMNVTPFEIMAQDVEAVIMVVNFYVEKSNQTPDGNELTERERDSSFWAAL